ncbi:MAG: nuclear transport factor 2 family protein [Acidobacteriota bacterium]|nr:nuclear transport factor 2 family protein [Acidobacteriota bacterium]
MILELLLTLVIAQPNTSAAVEELTQIEQRLGSTSKQGDCAGWGAMIAPEWSVTHITGETMTRAQAIEMCLKPPVPIESFTIDDVAVRVFGDAAVVTGRTTVTVGGASPVTVKLRFTDVFIRRSGRWLAVASHATAIAP